MKARRIGLAALLLAVLAAPLAHAADAIDSVVPNDCLMVVRFKSPAEFVNQLGGTRMGKAIMGTELADSGAKLLANGARFFSSLLMGTDWATLRDHFGSDVAIVVFERVPGQGRVKPPTAFVFDVSSNASAAKALVEGTIIPRMTTINNKMAATQQDYQGATIHRLQEKRKDPIYLAFAADVFVAGNEAGVKRIIDGAKAPGQALASHPPYQAVAKDVAVSAGGLCYVNVEALMDKAREQFATQPKKREGFAATGALTVKAVAVSAEVAGEGVRQRASAFTDGDTMGLMRLATQTPAGDHVAFKLAPADCHICVTAKYEDGQALLEAFKGFFIDMNGEEKMVEMSNFAQAIEQQLAMSWQAEFVDALSGELFLSMRLPNFAELAMERRKPGPQDFDLLIGVGLRDEALMKTTMNKLLASDVAMNMGLSVSAEEYKGRDVSVIALANKPNAAPCFTISDGAMVFALELEALERYVESLAEKRTLATKQDCVQTMAKLQTQGNVKAYVDTREILALLLQLADMKAPAPVKGFLPEAEKLAKSTFGMVATAKATPQGVVIEMYGPAAPAFGLTALAGMGELTKAK